LHDLPRYRDGGDQRVNMCPAPASVVHKECFTNGLVSLRTPISSGHTHDGRAVGTFSAARCPHCRDRIWVSAHDPVLAFLDTLGLNKTRHVYLDDPTTEVDYGSDSSSEDEDAGSDVWNDGEFTEAVCRSCHQQGLLRQSDLGELEQNWPDLSRTCSGCGRAFAYDELLLICAQGVGAGRCLTVQHDECPSIAA
jgi:DNA-directed RNA polymerase subunit RPC12/RpoP